ncbi:MULTISPECIES: hypothetical protein [Providencia]|uniref:hypothetical protein n=1 Tax=Providencia TaxID=586 RepID=UPI001F11B147|nr:MULTISPECIES: hypothetical protein [Providencia]
MTTKKPRKPPARKPTPLNAQMKCIYQTNTALAAGYTEVSACKRASQLMKDYRIMTLSHSLCRSVTSARS